MSREPVPLVAEDMSTFTRALGRQLREADAPPSHLTLMNMVARAAGFQNVQHMRAAHAAGKRLEKTQPVEAVDHRKVELALNRFDAAGLLTEMPAKAAVQDLCLWVFWSVIPTDTVLPERGVNAALNTAHSFGDPALLRRRLVEMGMMTRNIDGTDYRRVEMRPSPEARVLIREVTERRRQVEKAAFAERPSNRPPKPANML